MMLHCLFNSLARMPPALCLRVPTKHLYPMDLLAGTTFLSFRPSEIAAASALAAVSENQIAGFASVLSASEITVNKVSVF